MDQLTAPRTNEGDDDLWTRSQWDDPDEFIGRECEFAHFTHMIRDLISRLNHGSISVENNTDIISLARRVERGWSRYVDPAGSASDGTAEGTAIYLYECDNHQFTLRMDDEEWKIYRGRNTDDIVDIGLEFLETELGSTSTIVDNLDTEDPEVPFAEGTQRLGFDISPERHSKQLALKLLEMENLRQTIEDDLIDIKTKIQKIKDQIDEVW